MLNLSDKELDRLSREAASEHDPGDIIGPKSWDKLEVRLDRHLGHVTPHVGRGFYRLPFYYAPVVLLLVGATYYFTRSHRAQKEASSGSPPLTLVKPVPTGADKPSTSSQNPIQTDKSTSTLAFPPATAEQPTAPAAAGAGPRHDLTASGSATSATSAASASAAPGSHSVPASGSSSAASAGSGMGSPSAASNPAAGSSTAGSLSAPGAHFGRHHTSINGRDRSVPPSSGSSNSTTGLSAVSEASTDRPDNNTLANGTHKRSAAASPSDATPPGTSQLSPARQLALSTVRGPVPTKRPGSVSDSALRAFTVKAIPTPIQRKGGLYINRSLQIGALVAPDFSSVNSMSGDKPGSTIGLTADYQFAHHWYVGSGLLFSRKNYAAAPQNFHPPENFYSHNDMTQNGAPDVDFIKGSFTTLEIPLNLRYDFSVTGNTLFFASAGLSSYLMTTENCSYYYHWFTQPMTKSMHYANHPDYLFSSLDLSVGVEMGVSNTLSVLVAPYVKVPVRNIGFGQVDLSSVGINFILDFTPVLSRRR